MSVHHESSADALAAAAREILAERGPLPENNLRDALRQAGVDTAFDRTLGDILDDHRQPVFLLADGRIAWIPAVLEGRVFTHRLSEAEAAHDVVPWHPDLAPLAMLTDHDALQRLADGAPIREVFTELGEDFGDRDVPESVDPGGGVLLLPPGRFAELDARAGDLIGLRVTAGGFDVGKVDEVTAGDVVAALSAVLASNPGAPESLGVAVWTACADDPALFGDPAPPLGELVADAGWGHHDDLIAVAGFDFEAWRAAGRISLIRQQYDLADDEAEAVFALLRAFEQTLTILETVDTADPDALPDALAGVLRRPPEPDRMALRTALGFLAEPLVAAVVFGHADDCGHPGADALWLFTETVEPSTARTVRAALLWLRAKALETLGETASAEELLDTAESLDPSWPLTLMALARYASDRGDADRALSLLRRAGAPPDHELVVLMEHFQPAARIGLGRNERCWCGSGRKYKACHLNREQLPLEDRAAWLYRKAAMGLPVGDFVSLLLDAADERSRHWDDADGLSRALGDELVLDAVLFEGGAFEDFLALRGFLLPDDERLLAEQWLLTDRSVHEVVDVRRGEGITLRDVRTGDVSKVRERRADTQVQVGELYCARVVPAGDTMQIFGGMHLLSVGERDALIALLDDEPDPVAVVAALSHRSDPALLHTTEGDGGAL